MTLQNQSVKQESRIAGTVYVDGEQGNFQIEATEAFKYLHSLGLENIQESIKHDIYKLMYGLVSMVNRSDDPALGEIELADAVYKVDVLYNFIDKLKIEKVD